MIPGFEALVEQRIKNAQKKGEFDNLEGRNKPLKFDDSNVPEELRLATKILKNAGFLPPEIELKKKITHVEQLLEHTVSDSPERLEIQKRLNYLITKLNTARSNRPCSTMLSGAYRDHIIKKIS